MEAKYKKLINAKGQFIAKDRVGEKHGYFTIIKGTDRSSAKLGKVWIAKCECGKVFEIETGRLNKKKSCGCKSIKNDGMQKQHELAGKIVKDIKVIERVGRGKNGYAEWRSVCLFCGTEHVWESYYFTRGVCSCKCKEWQEKYAQKTGRRRIPNQGSNLNSLYGHYRYSAKSRGYEFNLTKEEFEKIIKQKCYYCGAEPNTMYTLKYDNTYKANGIDRVDNKKGYVVDNCVACCFQCNKAKNTMSSAEYRDWIKRSYNHLFGETRG